MSKIQKRVLNRYILRYLGRKDKPAEDMECGWDTALACFGQGYWDEPKKTEFYSQNEALDEVSEALMDVYDLQTDVNRLIKSMETLLTRFGTPEVWQRLVAKLEVEE